MSTVPNSSVLLQNSSTADPGLQAVSSSFTLSEQDLEELGKLPIDSLDTIRSKLVQLIDAITLFRTQLESSPLAPNSLSYPTLISKFLILRNHTEALSHALNTQVPLQPINRFELPSVRAERQEREKWEHGPSKQSVLGNLAVVPRGLEGLEDGKEWIVGVLTRTKLAPEIEKDEQELLNLLPPPPANDPSPTIGSLLEHTKNLIKAYEKHISDCRSALQKARHGRVADTMEIDISSDDGNAEATEAKYQWKMRVEVDDPLAKGSVPNVASQGPPSENRLLKDLLGFMRDGSYPVGES